MRWPKDHPIIYKKFEWAMCRFDMHHMLKNNVDHREETGLSKLFFFLEWSAIYFKIVGLNSEVETKYELYGGASLKPLKLFSVLM